MKALILWCLLLCLLLNAPDLFASGDSPTNFQLTTPPIPYPTFEQGTSDSKLTATYLHLSQDPISLGGGGIDYTFRGVVAPKFALGGDLPFYVFGGDITVQTTKVSLTWMTLAPTLDFQVLAYDSDFLSAILFAGFNYNFSAGFASGTVSRSAFSLSTTITSMAIPLGFQLGIPAGKHVLLAPFYSFTPNLGGSATVDIVAGGFASSTTTSIPSYSTQSFGADIIFPKMNFSVGSLASLTKPAQAGEKNMNLFMLNLTWHFHSGPQTAMGETKVRKEVSEHEAPPAETKTELPGVNMLIKGKTLKGP